MESIYPAFLGALERATQPANVGLMSVEPGPGAHSTDDRWAGAKPAQMRCVFRPSTPRDSVLGSTSAHFAKYKGWIRANTSATNTAKKKSKKYQTTARSGLTQGDAPLLLVTVWDLSWLRQSASVVAGHPLSWGGFAVRLLHNIVNQCTVVHCGYLASYNCLIFV